MNHIFSTGQVARLLGVQPYQIEYAHATGHLAEPGTRFLGKRVYTSEDVCRAAQHFGVEVGEHIVPVDDQREGT
jgi:DNA-binding transcriptional MerR regulator